MLRVSNVPRNDIPAALAFLDQELDAGRRIDGDAWAILLQLQDDERALTSAAIAHVKARKQAGKLVPETPSGEE